MCVKVCEHAAMCECASTQGHPCAPCSVHARSVCVVHPWDAADVGLALAAMGTRGTPQHSSNSAMNLETVVYSESITGCVLAKGDVYEEHLCLPDPTMFRKK